MQEKQRRLFFNEVEAIGWILFFSLVIKIYISSVFAGQSSDEFANIFITREVFTSGLKDYPELFMWFYYFISAMLLPFINDAFITTTIVSITFSTASMLILYLIAKKLFSKKIAFLTSFLLFLNPEFNLIGSVPLKESVYTFFILISLLMLIYRHVIIGALMIGMAFLTRMEGLLIGMPLYLANIFNLFSGKKLFKILFLVLLIFFLFIWFMNIWLPRPFEYLRGTWEVHLTGQRQQSILQVSSLKLIILRLIQSIIKLWGYLFDLFGPNIIFIFPGLFILFCTSEEKEDKRSLFLYVIFLIGFWFIYIFIFGGLIFNFHRYLYSAIPFIILLIALGFVRIYKIKRFSLAILFLFIFNLIANYLIYYHNVGKQYLFISAANKNLIAASQWIESNLKLDSKHKLFIDGIPGFNLYRKRYPYNIVRWDEFREKLAVGDPEGLLKFLKKENIKYVVWSDDNFTAVTIAPYLKMGKEIDSHYGKLIPVREWKKNPFKAIVFEFVRKNP